MSIIDSLDLLLPTDDPIGQRAAARAGWRRDRPEDYCHRCGASVGPAGATASGCAHCRGKRVAWDSTTRLGAYHPPLRAWLLAMKFGRRWGWCAWWAQQLADALPAWDRVVVVPVPLHWRRRCRRGFDQAGLLARGIGRERAWPTANLLRRVRATAAQSSLTALTKREANVRGAFTVKPIDLQGWTVVLVDDIKTSGATAGRCARLLRRQGAAGVHLAVVAVADPRGADFSRG